MKKTRWLALPVGLLALAGALAPAAQAPADANKALARQQLEVARQALADLDLLFKGGQALIDDPRILAWERRRVEAIRASGATKAEVVAAVEAYVKRMKAAEQIAKRRYQQAEADRLSLHETVYRTLEAEMWLNNEQAR